MEVAIAPPEISPDQALLAHQISPMFTGLVQAQGLLQSVSATQLLVTVQEPTDVILADLAIGDSVAVDGVCLTVEKILTTGFIATVSPETLQRTCLGGRVEQQVPVNLETSLRVGSKIGGHFVTGHVDGVGCLTEVQRTATSWELSFGAIATEPQPWQTAIAPYIAPKGSVAVNGISLTVAQCDRDGADFTVAVIPHTYAETNLEHLKPGSWVNIEGDVLGKYVERLLQRSTNPERPIDAAFLSQHGYL